MQPQPKLADHAIVLNEKDNVATALVDMPAGEYALGAAGGTIALPEPIRAGFKVAVAHVAPGETVYKYGYPIGTAKHDIRPGRRVHVDNIVSSV